MSFTKFTPNKCKGGIGYKVFIQHNGVLNSTQSVPSKEQHVPREIGVWLKATEHPYVTSQSHERYKTGWTIVPKKKDAENILNLLTRLRANTDDTIFVIRRVKFRGRILRGETQWFEFDDPKFVTDTTQADEMFILE